jgi:predicted metalloprotease
MQWRGRRQSSNIEDRRGAGGGLGRGFPRIGFPGSGGGGPFGGGLGGGLGPRGRLGGGMGLIVVVVLILLFSGNLFNREEQSGRPSGVGSPLDTETGSANTGDAARDFIAVVLADTEDVWNALFERLNQRYQEPTLVLFEGGVDSACGFAQTASGPFYCPADRKAYVDLAFFNELRTRFGAPGDFAQAYVIAHEIGHHVQNLFGTLELARSDPKGRGQEGPTGMSVRVELQADCFAGIWAHHTERTKRVLEPGDIAEALTAASAVGDDSIQRKTQGRVVPDAFTHGSAEQRERWFTTGYDKGEVSACDTLNATEL